MKYLGNYVGSGSVDHIWTTYNETFSAKTLTGSPSLRIYKGNNTTQESAAGITYTAGFDSVAGLNHARISLTNAFYETGEDYTIVYDTGTMSGKSVVGHSIASFSIEKRHVDNDVITLAGINAECDTALTDYDAATGAEVAALNDISAADVNAQCDIALADYDGPTKAEMDTAHALLATTAEVQVIDGIVDDILVDTGTTLPATLATIDAICDRILAHMGQNMAVFGTPTFDSNNNMTSANYVLYDTKANADTNDGSTGKLDSYTLTATFNASSELQTFKMTLDA